MMPSISDTHRDARRFTRLPASLPVRVFGAEHRLGDRTFDISEAGLGLLTNKPMAAGSLVVLRLELPRWGGVDVLGRVMWVEGGRVGVRFEDRLASITDLVTQLRGDLARL